MRGHLQRTVTITALLTSFGFLGSGGVTHSDEERAYAPPPQAVVSDVKAIKVALETLKARLNDVELDGLQRADELEAFREEFASLRNRLGTTLDSPPRSLNAASTAPQEGYASLTPDVPSTGAITHAAPIGKAAVPPNAQGTAPLSGQAAARPIAAEDQQIRKAEELLRRGDIASARLVLEHALRSNNPAVAFKLAETYDPRRLAELRVVGVRGDAQKARELYQRAQAGGFLKAQERVADLRN